MNIGLAIKQIRLQKQLTQGQLAEITGLSQTAISQIEKGLKRPNKTNQAKICKALEVPETLLYLYGLEDIDVPKSKKKTYELLYPSIQDMIRKLISDN